MTDRDIYDPLRRQMIDEIVADLAMLQTRLGRAGFSQRVLDSMGRVPRHRFVPVEMQALAYLNSPLPISHGKTISQPFIVALMTDLLEVEETDVVLEIGTGFGYQTAILSELAAQVYSVEIIEEIAQEGKSRLGELGYRNIAFRTGNGALGWGHHAPYDRIMVTAAPDLIPPALLNQLKPLGRMVVPTGIPERQQLLLVSKNEQGRIATQEILPVRFSELEASSGVVGRS